MSHFIVLPKVSVALELGNQVEFDLENLEPRFHEACREVL